MPFTTPSLPDENGVTTIGWLKEMLFDNIRFIACQLEAIPEGSVAHGVGEPGFEGLPLPVNALVTFYEGAFRVLPIPATGEWRWALTKWGGWLG